MQAELKKAKEKGREEGEQKAGGKKRKAQEGKTGAGLGVTQWYPSHREWVQKRTGVPGFLILRPPETTKELVRDYAIPGTTTRGHTKFPNQL